MLSSKEISMLIEATGTSVYMTLASTLMAYVIGLPIGILLVVCAPGGLKPKAVLYKILDFIVNITRSVPDSDAACNAAGTSGDRQILWCKCNDHFTDTGSSTVYCPSGGVFSS